MVAVLATRRLWNPPARMPALRMRVGGSRVVGRRIQVRERESGSRGRSPSRVLGLGEELHAVRARLALAPIVSRGLRRVSFGCDPFPGSSGGFLIMRFCRSRYLGA